MPNHNCLKIFSSRENQKKAFLVILVLIAILIVLILIIQPLYNIFKDINSIRAFVKSFGIFAPLVFIALQVLQVIFAPIPGQVAGLASGYIFGTWWGTLYTMIGVTFGSFIAFVLSRKFGRPFVEKVISKEVLNKFDYIAKEEGVFALFLIFLLPALPDDAICFLAGLTNIRIRTLVMVAFIGRLPGFLILNMLGNGVLVSQTKLPIIILCIMMVVSFILFFNKKNIESGFNNLVSTLRNKKQKKR
jgi:uncharacterized membrane protein YdjX (TVP38/TMEM64 family)